VLRNGADVALPADFAASADFLAESYGRKIYRFFSCSNDNSDQTARIIAGREPFLNDGAYLALYVLKWLAAANTDIKDAADALPKFSRENRIVNIDCPPQRILNKICANSHFSPGGGYGIGEGIVIGKGESKVFIRSAKDGNSLYLFAESVSSETARSACDSVERQVRKLMGS
jgi:hypothetical protein